jgi:hypothetical protein
MPHDMTSARVLLGAIAVDIQDEAGFAFLRPVAEPASPEALRGDASPVPNHRRREQDCSHAALLVL